MSRRSAVCSLEEALAAVPDGMRVGMCVGIGGILGRRRPMAACAALATAGPTRLHVYSFLAGAETELLVGAGCVSALTGGYIDPEAAAVATHRAIADGTVHWHETSEHVFVGGLLAAANGLPFWPTLGAVGSAVADELGLREVCCPYTGRPVLAVPATPLDIALIHATAATESGAVLAPEQREFLDDADVAVARAARYVIVTVDRLAGDDEAVGGRHMMLASFEVDAVVPVSPFPARPAQDEHR